MNASHQGSGSPGTSPTTVAAFIEQALELHRAGRQDEAEALYRHVLTVDPRQADALYLLGRIALARGNPREAGDWFARAIDSDRSESSFHHHAGEAFRAQGLLPQAIAAYRAAVTLKPDYALAWNQLGQALQASGAMADAEQALLKAIECPNNPEGHNQLGLLYKQLRRWDEAENCFHAALRLQPGLAHAHVNLGNLWRDRGDLSRAMAAYRAAIQLAPRFAAAHFNLGNVLRQRGQRREALAAYEAAVALDPRDAEALTNVGYLAHQLNDVDRAIEACQRAIELAPEKFAAHGNLGVCLQSQGRMREAIAAYQAAIRLSPDDAAQHSNLLYALNYLPDLEPAVVFAEHRAWGARHADPLTSLAAPHANDRMPERRLRIGYVSSHFRTHAVNAFTEPLLAAHHHDDFEIFCYADVAQADRDAATERLAGHADHWRDIAGRDDEQVSRTVREDRIDILVDLAGHIGGNRLLVFARRPAPVQVTYLGYQNTTGMQAMDYRLTDEWSDPPGQTDAWHTETLVRLPRTFFCYQASEHAPAITTLPADQRGGITFGSLNSFAKVTPRVLATWARVLQRVADARLLILAPWTNSLRRDVIQRLADLRIDARRIELCHARPQPEYLALINQVDIALDPFPFVGHTTTCDCLWQGVPVVSLAGHSYVSRFGSSGLVNLGLRALVASSIDEYVDMAAGLAVDRQRLRILRATLRADMAASVLGDAARFARDVEAAYRQMWRTWCERRDAKVGVSNQDNYS